MNLSFSPRRMMAVFRVETKQLLFDRSALLLIFALPILQILLYGYAVNLEPRHVPLAIAANAPLFAADTAKAIQAYPAVRLIGPIGRVGQAERAVRAGKAIVGLELTSTPLPMGLGSQLEARIVADGSDPATARPVVAALRAEIWRDTAKLAAGDAPEVRVQWLFTPIARSAWAVAPGLVGVIVMVSMLFLGAMCLVRERERGTWESLLATPITPAEALLGKLTPYLAMGVVQTIMLLTVIHLLFAVALPWSSLALVAAAPLFAGAYLLLGFAFSALAQTQLQAVQGAVGVYLPSLLLSGFLFPFDGMPGWGKAIGECLPLTHYIRASRTILLRQDGADAMLRQLPPIAAFAALALVAAVFAYRRRLD